MAINLKDIPDAVKAYLDSKVAVTISALTPASGANITPNETFTFKVTAANVDAANGGIALKNVKYRISVDNDAVAKIQVPASASGTATDLTGGPLAAGTFVKAFTFDPTNTSFDLAVGASASLALTGKAGSGASGGITPIKARVLADIDLNLLFPKGEDTSPATKTVTVIG